MAAVFALFAFAAAPKAQADMGRYIIVEEIVWINKKKVQVEQVMGLYGAGVIPDDVIDVYEMLIDRSRILRLKHDYYWWATHDSYTF